MLDRVNYTALDKAKNAFIAASRTTLEFAARYGFVPNETLGASANIFSIRLNNFFREDVENIFITLLPEGLGTADDARPADLTSEELVKFWHNIGMKTVAVMTNDAASAGIQTVLISLYLPSANPELVFTDEFMQGFLEGFVEGCRRVECVYISGETPQLKTKLFEDKLDIAGAIFGIMPPGKTPISSEKLKAGDLIILLASSGPHENGFTTLRSLAEKLPEGYRTKLRSGVEYWQALNAPSILYTPLVQDILEASIAPTNIEPITGHGWQKLMRPRQHFSYVIEKMLPVPEVFQFVEKHADMSAKEMLSTFNYGAGYAVFVSSEKDAARIVDIAKQHNIAAVIAGHVEEAPARQVVVKPLDVTLRGEEFVLKK